MSLGYSAPRDKNPEELKDEGTTEDTMDLVDADSLGGESYTRLNKQIDLDKAVSASIQNNLRLLKTVEKTHANF